jgi:surfeit locus 1 family protein
MPFKFRFRWIPFIATLIVAAIGFSLGQWQTRRAAAKEAIESKLTGRAAAPPVLLTSRTPPIDEIEYRRLRVTGEFDAGWPIYLDNRPHAGAAGFYVLMPLKIAGSDMHVIVARGWARRDIADRTKLPPIPVPAGAVELEGIARGSPGQVLQLGQPAPLRPGAIVQNLDIAELAKASGLALQPFIIEQSSDTGDGLTRDWPRPSAGAEKHRGYAFQWYALAATAILFFIVTGFRSARK